MKPIKQLSLLLSLIMLIITIAACADTEKDSAETTTSALTDVTESVLDEAAETEVDRNSISDDLPDMNFNGYNFRIYYYGDEFGEVICPEELSGDVINDAMYSRNAAVEERFNIEISAIYSSTGYNEHAAAEKRVIMAGDDAFDISFVHIIGGPNNSLEGLYMNFYDIPYLNFDKP